MSTHDPWSRLVFLERATGAVADFKMACVILQQAIRSGAEELYLEPETDDAKVVYVINGSRKSVTTLQGYMHASIVDRYKEMAGLDPSHQGPFDGEIAAQTDGKRYRIHFSIISVSAGERVVMRMQAG